VIFPYHPVTEFVCPKCGRPKNEVADRSKVDWYYAAMIKYKDKSKYSLIVKVRNAIYATTEPLSQSTMLSRTRTVSMFHPHRTTLARVMKMTLPSNLMYILQEIRLPAKTRSRRRAEGQGDFHRT